MSGLKLVANRAVDGQVPPWSEEAELGVLGACLIDPRVIPRVSSVVRPEHFHSARHGLIMGAIQAVEQAGRAVDPVTVGEYLRASGRMPQVGNLAFLTQVISSGTISIPNVIEHARVVYDTWRIRQAIEVHHRALAEGYTEAGDAQDYIDRTREALAKIGSAGVRHHVRTNMSALKAVVANIRKTGETAGLGGVSGIATGIRSLDLLTAGLHASELTVVGARPGVGKTAYLLQLANTIASQRIGAGFVSLEMTQEQLIQRALAAIGSVDGNRIRSGALTQADWSRLHQAATTFAKAPLWIDDRVNRTIAQVRDAAYNFLELARADGVPLGVLFVDYLQYISPSADKAKAPLREAIGQASKGLKELSRELGVPIICAAALNREVDKAGKVRWPRKSDIRDCGNIESDADNLIFLHREARMADGQECFEDDGTALLIVDKQRSGPTGTVKLWFQGQFSRFSERQEGEVRP